MIPQYLSPSPNNNSPFKALLLRATDASSTIPEDSLYQPHITPPSSNRRNSSQPLSISTKRQISHEKISRQHSSSSSPFGVVTIDYKKSDDCSSNSSSPFKRASIEESFITDSMLLKSSRAGGYTRRYPSREDATCTKGRCNTLPRMKRKDSHCDEHSSLPSDNSLDVLSKDFFLSEFIDKESTPVMETVKPAFSSSGSRKNSTSALDPIIFPLMEISEEEPFTNCMTALTEVTIIVDEIVKMAKQREGNFINFSKELFTLVRVTL